MADFELNGTNQIISYPGTTFSAKANLFLYGGTVGNQTYPKVDMSLWDQATMCGTCHVGGPFYEKDRLGNRLPWKTLTEWGPYFGGGVPTINPITSTVWQNYSSTTGKDKSFVTMSPWLYPVYTLNNGKPTATVGSNPQAPYGAMIIPAGANGGGSGGWMPMTTFMPDPNGGAPYPVYAGQVMMPNVKEMDCLFCHFQGYDNVAASVMTQAGSLSAAPAAGAGLFDMTPISPTYMGYNANNGKISLMSVKAAGMPLPPAFASYSSHQLVTLTPAVINNILAQPSDNNCMQCHATKTLKNLPEMFGVTGTSSGFLSSAPMIYDPANGVGPLGKRMTAFDINAPFMAPGGLSPAINASNYMNFMMPGLPYPQAMGPTPFRSGTYDPKWDLGGGNMTQTGPLYYYNTTTTPSQNEMKRSTMPFPRAEWFKRGDAWQDGQDVHSTIGCAGCHFTGDTTNKNQCDPARGFDMASTIQDGLPPFKNRAPVLDAGKTLDQTIKNHDTRNTIKRCEFCHGTATHAAGTDYYGNPVNTFGAPNADRAHAAYGLDGTAAVKVQMVDQFTPHGQYGGKGVPTMTNFSTTQTATKAGGTILNPNGNHLDVMDCTVCHVQKVSMAVRSLDASSGMRFPSIVGTDPKAGMLGLFEDPAPGSGMGGKLQEWKPLHLWQAYGNMKLPLSTANGSTQMDFRRKIYLSNVITAVLWNNEDPTIDANGDGAPGGLLLPSKPSLAGYKDIFTNDTPDQNNTQGFSLPIFDPWIEHDLKAGMNFGPAPLSVISVGFGGFGKPAGTTDPTGGAYQSLYGSNGMFSNDNWKYASVWSGAVVFTEPDQIANYKAYRTAIKSAGDGKSWAGTTMTLVGAPFMITHGVKPTRVSVLGKSCGDCHAPNAGFFTGGFTLTGSAIPSTKSYDPTATLKLDADGNLALNANGDPVRNTGMGVSIPGDNGNMMMRPLEPYRIKAIKGDLRGYMEDFNKLGQPRELNFLQDVTVGGTTYSYTKPIQRDDVLYPSEDGFIYYKIGDIDATTGHVKAGAVPMNGAGYASYLETLGAPPTASISLIGGTAPVMGAIPGVPGLGVTIPTGTISFAGGAANPNFTYTWTFSDLPLTDPANNLTGATVSRTIATAGSFYANLKVANNITNVTAITKVWVVVTKPVPASTATIGVITTNQTGTTIPLSVLPTHTRLYVNWGDGTEQSFMDSGAAYTSTHVYYSVGAKTVNVKVINGSILDSALPITATVNAYVTSSAGAGGTIAPIGSNTVLSGANQIYTITPTATPAPGYYLDTLVVNGTAVTPAPTYTFTANAAPLNTIAVTFGANILATQPPLIAGIVPGAIAPAGTTAVRSGQSVTYYITANPGYSIKDVQDNGVSKGAVSNYTLTNVTVPHTITATIN